METSRRYRGREDLPALLAFASRSLAERFPLPAAWHPGDLIWEMKGTYDAAQPCRFWETDGAIELVAWFVGPGEVWLEALPGSEHLVAEAVEWAEDKQRGRGTGQSLSVRAFESDVRRIAALEALGYAKGGPDNVWFRLDLDAPREALAPPIGFRVRDSVGVDPVARAKAHRDPWSALDHIGILNAASQFSTEIYLSLRDAPLYDPMLDILVEAPDGTLVANCIAWADTQSRTGIFEPVGTHPDYRGRRLARLAIEQGLDRLKARGMRWARIGTAHFNKAAVAAYTATGFAICDRTAWWTKAL